MVSASPAMQSSATGPRGMHLYLAQLAHQTGRFDDMLEHMTSVGKDPVELTAMERRLLSVAFKTAVSNRRVAWRYTKIIEQRESASGNTQKSQYAEEYGTKLEQELQSICDTFLAMAHGKLTQSANSRESVVYWWKTKADCHHYVAEFSKSDAKAKAAASARVSYANAQSVAEEDLEAAHPLRLGLALNYSVFLYELLQNAEEACDVARIALEDAHGQLDNIPEDWYKDSIVIMRYLGHNFHLWS